MIDISERHRCAIRARLPTLRLGEPLGNGAGGFVIAAHDEALDVPVALKVLAGGQLGVPFARDRLRTEAGILTGCRHPNLIEGIDYHEFDDMSLLVMEWFDGITVLQRQADTPLAPRQACEVVLAAARALHCVHEYGFLHGDIKPGNILFDPAGRHRLVDFGLARRWPFQRRRHAAGTPGYMPREAIVEDGVLLPATDVYALGVTVYELLADQPPLLSDDDPTRTMRMHADAAPIPLAAVVPTLPRTLTEFVMAAIEPRVENRIPSAAAFADRLADILGVGKTSSAIDEPQPPPVHGGVSQGG